MFEFMVSGKPRSRNRVMRVAAAAAFCIAGAAGAFAQSRQLKYIVPLAPGGPNDTVARLMADEIGRARGATIIVENRPGAGTVIGTELVARAAPDGNTILQAAGSFIVNATVKRLNFDPFKDFEHICYLVETPQLLVVPASSPYKTIDDFLKAAREKPGALTLAANGPATAQHIEFELFRHAAGVEITFVPFPGDAPALTAVMGEQVSAALFDYSTGSAQIADGKLRPLVAGTSTRIPDLPNVPTLGEIGFPDLEWVGTLGVVAPAKTPQPVLAELTGWFRDALKAPAIQPKLAALGVAPKGLCGADYTAFLRKQFTQFQRGVKEAGIKVE